MIQAPLLTLDAERVRLSGSSGIPGLEDCDEQHDGGPPPARIPVDHQSPEQDLLDVLIPRVVEAQARNEDIVAVESLAEGLLAEWSILSHGGRESFVSRLAKLLEGLAAGDMRGQFRYELRWFSRAVWGSRGLSGSVWVGQGHELPSH
jgi:hypothetical protein